MRGPDYTRLLLLAAIWGASFLFMRIASPVFGPINTAFFRVLFGFLGLTVILFLLKTPIQFNNKLIPSLVLGMINSAMPFLMFCIAALWLPAGYSAILNATTPLMGVLIGFLFFAESLTVKKVTGMVLGFAGIILISTTEASHSSDQMIYGVLACLIATTCYVFGCFLTKRWISEQGGLNEKLVALGSQFGAVLFLLPFFIYSIATGPTISWNLPKPWLSVLALGLICTALAYILYFRLISDIGAVRTLTVMLLIPLFGVFWGYLFLHEKISIEFIFGGVMVGVAVWLILTSAQQTISISKIR